VKSPLPGGFRRRFRSSKDHDDSRYCPPPFYMPPTASAALIVRTPAYAAAAASASYFPEGIEYAQWAHVVTPAPREAFADRLDMLDLFDD
jgi:hypothetical protein